jgi:dienelactone hydrolase
LRALVVATAALIVAGSAGSSLAGDLYVREELRIPDAAAGPRGLEALLVRPSEAGRHPLALINHGSPRSPNDRPNMTPWSLLPEAIEFARRGWAAAVVMRRGYGDSDGNWAEAFNGCTNPNYIAAGEAAAADLKTATEFLQQRPDIDAKRTIAVGVSAGGFATVALTADPPRGLVAAISFAGGRGSWRDNEVCRSDRLRDAFAAFGKRSRIPMLWVYAENDHFFRPELAEQFKGAFVAGGGNVDFIAAPAFGDDGHRLFSPAGIPIWSGYVDAFLQQHGLTLRAQPLPLPHPVLAVPAVLGPNGRAAFESYLQSPPHKAFALSPAGYFGWQSGVRTTEAAKASALQFCEQNGKNCSVAFVDDAPASKN